MTVSLQNRVARVQTAASRLTWMYGLARFAAVVVAILVGLALIDYLLRLHIPAGRWLLSVTAAMLAVVAFIRIGWPALRARQSAVATARRIEQCFPHLGEHLSSAIAFSAQATTEPAAGSVELRQAVIAQAEALSNGLDFQEILNVGAPLRALACAALSVAVAAAFAAMNPPAAGLAIARLAQPWRELAWPRRHELALVEPPQRLAKGDAFEATVMDRRGALPDDLQFILRYESPAGWQTEIRPLKPLGGRTVIRLDNVTHSFEYRASGGDDDTMPWIALSVLEPPKLTELQVIADPPAYTGLPRQSAGRIVKALIGSQLRIRGTVDQPIRSAAIRSATRDLPLPAIAVEADGCHFVAPPDGTWLAERSGSLWLELIDEHGLPFGRDTRIELEVVPDNPPSIAWEQPADESFVTRRARIHVKGLVKDDLAIRRVDLRYIVPGKSDAEQVVEMVAGPELPPRATAAQPAASLANATQLFDFAWDLSDLAGLSPGDVLSVRITAEDYKPQLATTPVRRVTIIAEDEFQSRVASKQSAILSQLADALRLARLSVQQLQSAVAKMDQAPLAADRNLLQAVQHNQTQVERLLGPAPDGAEGQTSGLLDELIASRMESPASSQRLKQLLTQIHALNEHLMPSFHQELTDAIKAAAESNDASPDEARRRLRHAAARNEEVVRSLEEIVGTLTEWEDFGRIARELRQILEDQNGLIRETDELQLKIVPAGQDVSAADRAAARQLSQRELELARRLDKLQARIEDLLVRTKTEEVTAATALRDASARAWQLAIGQQMREAASQLGNLQLGKAHTAERRVSDALQQLVEALSPRRGTAQLIRIGAVVADLVDRQRIVITETGRLESQRGNRDPLDARQQFSLKNVASEQQLLAGETEQARKGLVLAEAFAFALERAAMDMRRASGMLLRGQTAAATQNVERSALTSLEEIQTALLADEGQSTPDDQAATAPEQSPRIGAAGTAELKLLKSLQESINRRTAALESQRANGPLNLEQQQELDLLATEQKRLAEIMLGLIQLSGAESK